MSLFTDIEALTVTISNGTALSPALNLGAKTLVGIAMPAAWTAADLTFQASPDGGTTFDEVVVTDFTSANAVSTVQVHSPAASQFIQCDPTKWRGVNVVKLRSGTSGSPVNQGADRVMTLLVRGIT
jgi:hypothetical protein